MEIGEGERRREGEREGSTVMSSVRSPARSINGVWAILSSLDRRLMSLS